MLRALLSLVLMPIVALPHGICFCQYVEAASPCLEPFCCEGEMPAPPAESPDDDDTDCPCKLREVPANSPALDVTRGGNLVEAAFDLPAPASSAKVSRQDRTLHLRACRQSVPLILCALRI